MRRLDAELMAAALAEPVIRAWWATGRGRALAELDREVGWRGPRACFAPDGARPDMNAGGQRRARYARSRRRCQCNGAPLATRSGRRAVDRRCARGVRARPSGYNARN